jgi:diguanylate cyclase (GGDEF)-like protein
MAGFTLFMLLALAGTMLAIHTLQPGRLSTVIDISNFLICAFVLPVTSTVAVLLGRLRDRLQQQRAELRAALARIQDLATRDDLTGLPNRRHAQERLELEGQRQARGGPPFAIALIDLDHFKALNDGHGHAGGDAVLRRFADAARDGLRAVDLLSRWGGEEFVVLFPGAQVGHAQAALQRLQQALADTDLSELGIKSHLSFSAGLVALSPSDSIELALERADQAMYRAKAGGRCRTELG